MNADSDALFQRLEADLRRMLRTKPPADLAVRIDERMRRALDHATDAAGVRAVRAHRLGRARSIALLVALVGAVGLTGIVGAQAILDPDQPRAVPAVTNFGQPFWNTPIMELTPPEAHQFAVERGFEVTWQIEDRVGTEETADDVSTRSDTPPECGDVVAGALFDGVLHMVAELNVPESPESACGP
jgi:hypothetical protein